MNKEINYDNLTYNDKDSAWGYFFVVLIPLVFQLVASLVLTLIANGQGITVVELLKIPAVASVYYVLNGLCLLAIFFVFNKVRKKKTLAAAKIEFKFGWLNGILCVVLALVVLFGFNYFVNLMSHLMSIAGYNPDASMPLPLNTVGDLFLNLFVLALVPAICEELIYRGIILNGMRKFGVHTAVFASAAIFAIAHGSAMQTVYQFILGVALGYVLIKTGSLIASMVVHFLNNATVIIINYIANTTSSGLNEALSGNGTWSALDIVLAICMALASVAVIIMLLSFMKQKQPEVLYEKKKEKIDQTALKIIIISAIISFIIWCLGTFL